MGRVQICYLRPLMTRTVGEFNAMCQLGAARHLVAGGGFMDALAVEAMQVGPNGEVNFPTDKRRMAYAKVHGTWPSDEQLQALESDLVPSARPALSLVEN